MQPRVIGRYRRSDGEIVRCDVEPEAPESPSRRKDGHERVVVSKERSEKDSKDRSLARHEGHSFMLML